MQLKQIYYFITFIYSYAVHWILLLDFSQIIIHSPLQLMQLKHPH